MLELSKKILTKVSFDHSLFFKELSKALKWINPKDIPHFKVWCLKEFNSIGKTNIEFLFYSRSLELQKV